MQGGVAREALTSATPARIGKRTSLRRALRMRNLLGMHNLQPQHFLERIEVAIPVHALAYSISRCTVSIENAGRHTAMYSAPPSWGVE